MPLDDTSREKIEAFRDYIEDSVANDDRYGVAKRRDLEDESALVTRFEAGPSCWFEVVVRPLVPQVRVGFVTDDRLKSEEVEQAIQDSGDSMAEFVGIGLAEAGLNWDQPPVEHFREGGEYYCFATPLDLDELADLDLDEIRNKTLRMLDGYLIAFGPGIMVPDEDSDDDLEEDEED